MWYRLAKQVDFVYTLEPLVATRHHAGNLGKNRNEALAYTLRLNLRYLNVVQDPVLRAS
jgi:hypothetical protein